MAEANFTPFSLIEVWDYEYFYEEESDEKEKELSKNIQASKLIKIKENFLETFIDVNNTSFLCVFQSISNETIVIDFRKKLWIIFMLLLIHLKEIHRLN